MVTIGKFGEGVCAWCCQSTEGVTARFADGLQGFFCKRDFWAALKARADLAAGDSPSPESLESPVPAAKLPKA